MAIRPTGKLLQRLGLFRDADRRDLAGHQLADGGAGFAGEFGAVFLQSAAAPSLDGRVAGPGDAGCDTLLAEIDQPHDDSLPILGRLDMVDHDAVALHVQESALPRRRFFQHGMG